MTPELAVFQACDGIVVVRWVFEVDGDTLYITDDKGLTEYKASGTTRRVLGMARWKAFKYDTSVVHDGQRVDCGTLEAFR